MEPEAAQDCVPSQVLSTLRDNRQQHQHTVMAVRLVQSRNLREAKSRAIYGSEVIAWCAECGAYSSQRLQNLVQGRCRKGSNASSVKTIMQGKRPLHTKLAVDTNTICRIETVYQLTQRLLRQQGARDRMEPTEAQPATNERSSATGAPSQGRPRDASVEVVCQQPQHYYMGEDEELDPMGWGFSIDQP